MGKIVRHEFLGNRFWFWILFVSGIGLPLAILYLLDTTDVRLLDGGVDLPRRIRNLGQVLDMPERLDKEVVHLLLAAYTDGPPHLQGLDTPVKHAMELRRRHRLRVDGFRSMDRQFEADGNGRNPIRKT